MNPKYKHQKIEAVSQLLW